MTGFKPAMALLIGAALACGPARADGLIKRIECLEARLAAYDALLDEPVQIKRVFLNDVIEKADGSAPFKPGTVNHTPQPIEGLTITLGPEYAGRQVEARFQVALQAYDYESYTLQARNFMTLRLTVDGDEKRGSRAVQIGRRLSASGSWRWRMRDDGESTVVGLQYTAPRPELENTDRAKNWPAITELTEHWPVVFLEVVIPRRPEWPAACGPAPEAR